MSRFSPVKHVVVATAPSALPGPPLATGIFSVVNPRTGQEVARCATAAAAAAEQARLDALDATRD